MGAVSLAVNIRKTLWPMQTKLREALCVDCHSSSWMLPPLTSSKDCMFARKLFLESPMFDTVDMTDVHSKDTISKSRK